MATEKLLGRLSRPPIRPNSSLRTAPEIEEELRQKNLAFCHHISGACINDALMETILARRFTMDIDAMGRVKNYEEMIAYARAVKRDYPGLHLEVVGQTVNVIPGQEGRRPRRATVWALGEVVGFPEELRWSWVFTTRWRWFKREVDGEGKGEGDGDGGQESWRCVRAFAWRSTRLFAEGNL
jgi:hypothetical protein